VPPGPLYRLVTPGVEALAPSMCTPPRHRHTWGYATVVLSGTFVEASFAGRFAARPGDVLLHGAFDCHANTADSGRKLEILRLPWSDTALEGHFHVRDPDALARLAERDAWEATFELRSMVERARGASDVDWPEQLASDLTRRPSSLRLREWAAERAIAPETVSRGFRRAFGVSPKRFRLEARGRSAWNLVVRTSSPLTRIAHELEFADQAHMSRTVRALTGHAPRVWRQAADAGTLMAQLRASR
jgi:AraC-like DNA-binding protein